MADQRPAFRFRLPWLPAAPAARATIAPRPPGQPPISATPLPTTPQIAETQAPSQPTTRRTAETQAPTQPMTPTATTQQTAGTQAPTPPTTPQTPETQVATQPATPTPATPAPTTSEAAETQAPTQSTATFAPAQTTTQAAETETPSQPNVAAEAQTPSRPSETSSTPINAGGPSFRPPGLAPAQIPQPQSSRTESQPTAPYREATQPQVPSLPASPSRATTQSRAPSQPSTPSRAASSPSRTASRLSSTSPTATQPRSPSRLATRLAGETSSPSSPSRTAAQRQPVTEYLTETASPPNREHKLDLESSQPTSNSNRSLSSLSDKEEPELKASEQQSLELRPKPEHVSGTMFNSQNQNPAETRTVPDKIALQPSKESDTRTFTPTRGLETPEPTKKLDTSTMNGEPESSPEDSKQQETKEVKEVMQESKDKKHEEVEHKDGYLLTGQQGSPVQTKAQPTIAFQSDQTQKTPGIKEMIEASAPNGKETKRIAHQRNKSMVGDSSRKLDMSNRENIPLHKEIRDDISKLVHKMAVGDRKHSIDDRPVSVITLAGENRGASLQLGSDPLKKGGAVHIHRGYKKNPAEGAETTTDGEGSTKGKIEGTKSIEDQATEAYVNSNVQGINNSIMFGSSITEGNPGVQLIHSRLPTEFKESTGREEHIDSDKTTNAQKLTYQPMVRRRCLRGLFLESSDSDTDNNAKPQRHGCRIGRKDKGKENKTDVL